MKKQILFFAAFLFAAGMYAQAVCWDCSIDQIGAPYPGTGNYVGSHSTQNQNRITQLGTNTANVLQLGYGNESQIDQDGKMSSVLNHGDLNIAYVTQHGDSNESRIGQHGDSNTSTVAQLGTKNYAYVDIGEGYAENNTTSVDQNGSDNHSFQIVRYDNNTATVTQVGSNNYAEQDQSQYPGGDLAMGSTANINQNGTYNQAKQYQRGSLNSATSKQIGDSNTSVEAQFAPSTWVSGDFVNISEVTQTNYGFDDGNRACVGQLSLSGKLNTSTITQTSNSDGGNFASVLQGTTSMGSNYSTITQNGGNTACVLQINGSHPFPELD